jgi:flagellar L-ring protein precursor FlgH
MKNKLMLFIVITIMILTGCSNNKKNTDNIVSTEPLPEAFADFIDEEEDTEYSGSLFSSSSRSLYSDKKASKVGDLLSIIIRENASAQQTTSNSRAKGGKIDAKAGTGFLNMLPDMGAEGNTKVNSSGTTKRSGNLTARVSARVMKKDSSGNLYVKGTRNVLINNELQEIEITGFVRPQDISMENSIESAYLSDAQVKYNGKLVFDGKAKPGIISNFLSSIVGIFF